jgi:Fe-S-cluster containining protein
MTIEAAGPPDAAASCPGCEACCCRLEVLLMTDTGVPDRYIEVDQWGGRRMARLDDGWCSALDRNTLLCSIYEQRPGICRALEMGGYECLSARTERGCVAAS